MSSPIIELSETEIGEIINGVANRVSPKYRFGYHSYEDMAQQAVLLGWSVLTEGKFTYGPAKTKDEIILRLRSFMATHMRNRLHNFRRNFSCRYENKNNKYNSCKYNIMHPVKMGDSMDSSFFQSHDAERIKKEELIKNIRAGLSVEMIKTFLKMQADVPISPKARAELILKIREINAT